MEELGNESINALVNEFGNTSGTGKDAIVPEELKKFNWGAFLLNWIWCIGYKKYLLAIIIFVVSFIPFLGLIIDLGLSIYLGINGNKWAWQAQKYKSIDDFQHVQKKWATWGIIIMLLFAYLGYRVGRTGKKLGEDYSSSTSTMTLKDIDYGNTSPTTTSKDIDYGNVLSSIDKRMLETKIRKSVAIIEQSINMEFYKGTDFSQNDLAKHFSEFVSGIQKDNVLNANDGIKYTFHSNGVCKSSNDKCFILVETNGEKGPNQVWENGSEPKDQFIVYMKRTDDNKLVVLIPQHIKDTLKIPTF